MADRGSAEAGKRSEPTAAVVRAKPDDRRFVLALLDRCGLPTDGVREHFGRFLVSRLGRRRVGCVGMEVYCADALSASLQFQGVCPESAALIVKALPGH